VARTWVPNLWYTTHQLFTNVGQNLVSNKPKFWANYCKVVRAWVPNLWYTTHHLFTNVGQNLVSNKPNFWANYCKVVRAWVSNLWYAYHWWCAEVFQVIHEKFSKNKKYWVLENFQHKNKKKIPGLRHLN